MYICLINVYMANMTDAILYFLIKPSDKSREQLMYLYIIVTIPENPACHQRLAQERNLYADQSMAALTYYMDSIIRVHSSTLALQLSQLV